MRRGAKTQRDSATPRAGAVQCGGKHVLTWEVPPPYQSMHSRETYQHVLIEMAQDNMCQSKADAALHGTRVWKQRSSNRQLRQPRGRERHTAPPINPAVADSEAATDSALHDADRLPSRPRLWSGLLGLGFIIPQFSCVMLSLIVSEWLLVLLGYYKFGLHLHLKQSWVNSGWCGSVDWGPACEPEGRWFKSQSRHMLELWARSPVGGAWEVTTHWYFSLFLPPFHSLKNK